MYDVIKEKQSVEVDAISGATLSSGGIKSGVGECLAKASAATAVNAIDKIKNYTSDNTSTTGNINNVKAAANYYELLSDYERGYVTNADTLYKIADIFDIEITLKHSGGGSSTEKTWDTTYNDTYWGVQEEYYRMINSTALADHGLTGKGVTVAVVDSGLASNLADLDYGHVLPGYDYVNGCVMDGTDGQEYSDSGYHGTMVAGILAAVTDNHIGISGLLSEADIVPLKCSPKKEDDASSEQIAQIIRDAVDTYHADVITTSLEVSDTEALREAVAYAAEKGVIVVGAAGNSGTDGSTEDAYIYPASYDEVISVGAVDNTGKVRRNSQKNDKVDVVAPGLNIVSLGTSVNGYRCMIKSGTSFSAPVVAAMAAAAKQADPDMTTEAFRALLAGTSKDLGESGKDSSYGYGLVDMERFASEIKPIESPYADGTYTGVGAGRNGDVVLDVTLKGGKVADIAIKEQKETPWAWAKAAKMIDNMKEAQPDHDAAVVFDGISGATLSSNGIRSAVADAFVQAGPDMAGSGTWDDPYKIRSASQLETFAALVDGGENYAGQYVELVADIDLSGMENWNLIGGEGNKLDEAGKLFAGHFDGKGHTISGLSITGAYDSEHNIGLFSTLDKTASVSNVQIADANIAATALADPEDAYSYAYIRAGLIAGDTIGGNASASVQVDSCGVAGTITLVGENDTQLMAGGILGRGMKLAKITNSYADVAIDASIDAEGFPGVYAGGIVGMTTNVVLVNDRAFGTVRAATPQVSLAAMVARAGGIAGSMNGRFWNVVSDADVSVSSADTVDVSAGILFGDLGSSFDALEDVNDHGVGYYASDAVMTVNQAETAAAAVGTYKKSSSYDVQYAPTAMTKAELSAEGGASIFNSGLRNVAKALEAYGMEGISLRNWQLESGTVLPTGEAWAETQADDTIFASGQGTQEDPYCIETAEQLVDFAGSLTDALDYSDTYIQLNADIDISHIENWEPIGGIAGYLQGYQDSSSYQGAVIDHCRVFGTIEAAALQNNNYVGGIADRQYKGAVINSMSDTNLRCTVVTGEAIAAVGGLVGMNNRGLVANSYTLGDTWGSMDRNVEEEIEGMAAVSSLVGVNAGDVANCYSVGSNTSEYYSIYTGAVAGWVTGIGKAYDSFYNLDADMTIWGRKEAQPQPYGTKVIGGVNEEGEAYEGGVVDRLNGFCLSEMEDVAAALNENFQVFAIDVSKYGLAGDVFCNWRVEDGMATFAEDRSTITYVQPEAEKVPVKELVLQDGEWYGRDAGQNVAVKITVLGHEIVSTEVLQGTQEDEEAYNKALETAKSKRMYGDFSGYGKADTSIFTKGDGTKENPYRVTNESQLRYIAQAVNADEVWEGVYFRQTNDIALSDEAWLPIGWGIKAEIKGDQVLYSAYPFRGNYDGGNYTISNLRIGTEDEPASAFTAAMFGFTGGDWETNELFGEDTRKVELKNIHLEDVYINNEVPWDTYTAGLIGTAQNGIFVDNCSVTGTIRVKASDIAARAAGLAASVLRGGIMSIYYQAGPEGLVQWQASEDGGFVRMKAGTRIEDEPDDEPDEPGDKPDEPSDKPDEPSDNPDEPGDTPDSRLEGNGYIDNTPSQGASGMNMSDGAASGTSDKASGDASDKASGDNPTGASDEHDATNRLVKKGGQTYIVNANGAVVKKQFVTLANGRKYYCGKSGAIIKGRFFTVKGSRYLSNKNGVVIVGKWVTCGNKKYYCSKTGKITKVKKIKKK